MIRTRKILDQITPYQLPTIPRGNKIRLDLNENVKGCSPAVRKAINKAGSDDIAMYPEYQELTEKLAHYLRLVLENILLTNGADEAIRCVMDCYIEKGEEVIIPVPNYSMFGILAQLRGAEAKEVLYGNDFSFPLEDVFATISSRTRLVVISNPNSLLGTSIKRAALIKILRKTQALGSVVLLDETYHHFAQRTFVDLIKDFDNLFVIHTFSKVFGLAGLRLGYVASSEANIENLRRGSLPYAVNSLAVIAGSAALEDKKYVEGVVKEVNTEKRFLYKALKNVARKVYLTDTNFLLAHFGNSSAVIHQKLMDRGILVKNVDSYPLLNGFLRIAVGTHRENTIVMKALKEIMPKERHAGDITPEAILFDMDGVLVDVSASYRLAIKKTAEYFLKEPVSVQEIQRYKEQGGYNNDWDLTEMILLSHGMKVSRKNIVKVFQHFYRGKNFNGFIRNEKWLLDRKVLHTLSKDFKLGIVTGRPKREAENALKRFEVKDCFEIVIAMEDVRGKSKPDPHGIHLALKTLKAKRALYVGDTIDDILSAASAGVTPVGIIPSQAANRRRIEEVFRKSGAKHILKNVNKILEVLE